MQMRLEPLYRMQGYQIAHPALICMRPCSSKFQQRPHLAPPG